jgi:hypothetical protein
VEISPAGNRNSAPIRRSGNLILGDILDGLTAAKSHQSRNFICRFCEKTGRRIRDLKLEDDFIYVTPQPILSRLDGLNDGMPGRMKMLGGVLIGRLVAAAHMATNAADAQMNPPTAHLQAFFAAFGAWFDFLNLVEMGTGAHNILQ